MRRDIWQRSALVMLPGLFALISLGGVSPERHVDPHTLIPAGSILDQAAELSLQGGELAEFVVLSHTVRLGKDGQPVLATVPEECAPRSSTAEAPCAFRFEIFAFDPGAGWTSRYRAEEENSAGLVQGMRVRSFGRGPSTREAAVVTSTLCAAARCPFENHTILTMTEGQVRVAYQAHGAALDLAPASATFTIPNYPAPTSPTWRGNASPNGRFTQTVGWDQERGDLAVTAAALSLCASGRYLPVAGRSAIGVRCRDADAPAYDPAQDLGFFETTEATVVEPATVGGIAGLREDDRITVEFAVRECPELRDPACFSTSLTPRALRISVLTP